MNDLPPNIEFALQPVYVLPCRSVSLSSYGAIQLGFGEATDYLIAGKFAKKRFEVEIGSFGSSWTYSTSGGGERQRRQQSSASDLLGDTLTSIQIKDDSIVIETKSGAMIEVEGDGADEDIFYAHIFGGSSVFFSPSTGWSIE